MIYNGILMETIGINVMVSIAGWPSYEDSRTLMQIT